MEWGLQQRSIIWRQTLIALETWPPLECPCLKLDFCLISTPRHPHERTAPRLRLLFVTMCSFPQSHTQTLLAPTWPLGYTMGGAAEMTFNLEKTEPTGKTSLGITMIATLLCQVVGVRRQPALTATILRTSSGTAIQ